MIIPFIFGLFFISLPLHLNGESNSESAYTTDFRMEECTFKSEGKNAYFKLNPGYQLVLKGEEEGKEVVFVIEVLNDTKQINVPGIGMVSTRAVKEKEWADGKPYEQATSYFAICEETGDVYDFGDEVEIYKEDGTVSTAGTWFAGEKDEDGVAMPGIFMPGTFMLGARYYQQLADGLSSERGENIAMGLTVKTDAGTFEECILVRETNTVEGPEGSDKTHCPGIGLVAEDTLKLTNYGYNVFSEDSVEKK